MKRRTARPPHSPLTSIKRELVRLLLALLFCGALALPVAAATCPQDAPRAVRQSTWQTAQQDPQPETGDLPLEEYLLDDSWAAFFESQPFTLEELRGKSFGELLQALWQQLLAQLRAPLKTALRVTAVLLALGVLRLLFREGASPELEYTLQTMMTVAVFLVLSTPVLQVLEEAVHCLETSRVFLAQFVPVLCSMLAAAGQGGTAAVYGGVFFSVLLGLAEALHAWVAPLIRIFLALSITRGLCGSLQLDGFIRLLRGIIYWAMGLVSTLFCAYLGLQSVLAGAADTLAMRAGKFVVAGGIPIVGGAVAEAMGTVCTGLRLVRGAAGVLGVAALLLLFLPSLLQCLVYGFVCSGCAAVAQLLDNGPAQGLLEGLRESLRMLGAILVLYLVLLVLSTALMVVLGGAGAA